MLHLNESQSALSPKKKRKNPETQYIKTKISTTPEVCVGSGPKWVRFEQKFSSQCCKFNYIRAQKTHLQHYPEMRTERQAIQKYRDNL